MDSWGETVDELNEYRNLGLLKNYIGSFSSNIDNNIEKTRSKAGMIFSSNFDRQKVTRLYLSSSVDRLAFRLFCLVLSSLR